MRKNPFIFDEPIDNIKSIKRIKKNNAFLFTILSNLFLANGDLELARKKTMPFVLKAATGELLFTDRETGINTNDLGGKFRFLLLELDKNSKAREVFSNSLFTKCLENIFYGDVVTNPSAQWMNYKLNEDDQKLPNYLKNNLTTNRSALNGALNIYANDNSTTIGLDMRKVIDTLIVKDETTGEYKIEPREELEIGADLTSAVEEQIRILKSTNDFKEFYKNTYISKDLKLANNIKSKDEEERY